MSTISRDVLSYAVAPYISLADLALERSKDPALEREYQQRIQDLLANGKDYEILAAGLEIQDPQLLQRFFQNITDEDDLEIKLRNAIVGSLNDGTLDLLIATNKYNIADFANYLPLTILLNDTYQKFVDEYDDFIDEYQRQGRDLSRLDVKDQFVEYVGYVFGQDAAVPLELDPNFRDYYIQVFDNLEDEQTFSDAIWNILNQPRYLRNPPVDLLLGDLSSVLTDQQTVEILRRLKQTGSDRFNDYLQYVINDYSDLVTIDNVLTDRDSAKALSELLDVIYGFH